ncbi:MAG TPA: cell division protein FtsQ/DivIB [Gammaproteobacteria bacterium]|nr:cell division protein FtsQ/DivIB [Gammaproteobacteria bacterium]
MRAEAATLSSWRRSHRSRRWIVFLACGIALAVFLRLMLGMPAGPAVTRIVVTVPPHSPVAAGVVEQAAAAAIGSGIFTVRLAAVQARIERLPWVAKAEVRRVWPDALAVTVTLERPVARWGEGALVDASAHLFRPPQVTGLGMLPALSGPPGTAAQLLDDLARARAVVAARGLQVTALRENARGELRVVFAGGLVLELGRERPLAKLARFERVAAPALGTALARAAAIDLRYPNGFAVSWRKATDGRKHGQKD